MKKRVKIASGLLYQIQDAETGHVPYYGQNDGSLILPLTNCDYLDFRPVVQATHYYFLGRRILDAGPWDEDLLWLFGQEALSGAVEALPRRDLTASDGGYYTLRSEDGFAFVRCALFRHRPGQADMLHVDLWWQGQNIAMDAGTYSYNAPSPWNNPFAHTAYHNTVTVDGLDQMDRVGRFLWLPWVKGSVSQIKKSANGHIAYWEGVHDGYSRLPSPVTHRRGILQFGPENWLVFDALIGPEPHVYRLHWLLPDFDHRWDEGHGLLTLTTPKGLYTVQVKSLDETATTSLSRAEETSPRGWRAPHYSYREPALSLDVTATTPKGFFWTLFSPESCDISFAEDYLRIKTPAWSASVELHRAAGQPLVKQVILSGQRVDRLQVT